MNADSENVLALKIKSGQTDKVCSGSLQEASVRDEICRVMEGGEKAFVHNYLYESSLVKTSCFWFTTLVSNKKNDIITLLCN